MGGICGIVNHGQTQPVREADITPMVCALRMTDRGDNGIIVRGQVGLGFLDSPGQRSGVAEMMVHGRSVVMAFHGYLYNEPRVTPSGGGPGGAVSDLIKWYLDEGIGFVKQLRGDFAIAVWDGVDEALYLAADRFRVHPLMYLDGQDRIVFSSRMSGILSCPVRPDLSVDPRAVVDVVALSSIPTPKTIFKEVKKLAPGHILSCRNGVTESSPYWDIDFLEPSWSRAELARTLRTTLRDAVSVRYRCDEKAGEIGTFLSGGVDSTTVTGLLTEVAGHRIKSFSIGFKEQRFNEIGYARIAAKAFNAEHHEYFVTPEDTRNAIPMLLAAFDEPFANASAIPTYYCAKLARDHGVSVLYAGDGGDELFAGNERYAAQRMFEWYQHIPAWLRRPVLEPALFYLADALGQKHLVKIKKYVQRANIPYPDRLSSYGVLRVIAMASILSDGLIKAVGDGYDAYEPVGLYYSQARARRELDRQLYIDLKLAISDNDLFKVTRMTGAADVAVRFPFLDHRLADVAATIPAEIKMRGRELRSFFKSVYSDLLPREVRAKQKHGFGLPIPMWLRTDKLLSEMMHDLVLGSRSIQRGYFLRRGLEGLVEKHRTDETSFYGTVLWNMMVLELWHREYSAKWHRPS